MSSITEGLLSQLQGNPLQQISQKLGIDAGTAGTAIAAALPLLIGTLGRNASQPQGASQLFGALQDHRGQDISNVLGTVLGGGGQGSDILGHMFGPRQQLAAQGLGSATGIAPDKAHMLLRWLAPIAMAYIAKRMFDARQGHSAGAGGHGSIVAADNQAASPPTVDDLGKTLGQEATQIQQQGGIGGGLLGAVLDRNHDGKVDFSDLAGMAGNLGGLGSVLGGALGSTTRTP